MPSTVTLPDIFVRAIPVKEIDGLLWLWMGEEVGSSNLPQFVATAPNGYSIQAEIVVEVTVEHGLLIENLLDLAHAPFTHTGTFAKG